MDVSIVTTLEQFDALEDEWRELIAHSAAGAELFHDPAVIRVLLADASQGLSPAVIVVRHDNRVQCIAPFYVHPTTVPLRFSVIQLASFPARTLRLFGDRIIFRESGHDPQDVLMRIFETLSGMRSSFDLIWIYCQRLDDPLWRFLNSGAASQLLLRPVPASLPEKLHCLDFNRTFEEYVAEVRTKPGFPGKTIRRFWRDMKDRCEVRRITRPDEVATFLDDVNRVYATTWQARTYGARTRNGREDIARLEAIAALGYLRSYVLVEEARAIAFVLGYQYRGQYIYEETGYDSTRSSTSPGSVLTHAVIEDLFRADTPRELSFGFGDGAYKRTFGNVTYDVLTIYVVWGGRWRLVLSTQQLLDRADELGRALITRLKLDQTVRRLLKRQR